jgi:hypothetical protein
MSDDQVSSKLGSAEDIMTYRGLSYSQRANTDKDDIMCCDGERARVNDVIA